MDHARIGQQSGDVAATPLHDLAPCRALGDVNGKVARKDDDHLDHDRRRLHDNLARYVRATFTVRREPLELLARGRTDRLVRGESLDQLVARFVDSRRTHADSGGWIATIVLVAVIRAIFVSVFSVSSVVIRLKTQPEGPHEIPFSP